MKSRNTTPVKTASTLVQRDLYQFLQHIPVTTPTQQQQQQQVSSTVVLNEPKCLTKVISGGQIGVQQAGLESALNAGLQVGGTCPHDYMTLNGQDVLLRDKYKLTALSFNPNISMIFKVCAQLNVEHSDGTVIFRLGEEKVVDKIIGFCQFRSWQKLLWTFDLTGQAPYKPYLIIKSLAMKDRADNVAKICSFVKQHNIDTLNIAGNTSDAISYCVNMALRAESILDHCFKFLK